MVGGMERPILDGGRIAQVAKRDASVRHVRNPPHVLPQYLEPIGV